MLLAVAMSTPASLLSSLTELLSLALAICGLETLRDGEEANFGVEAQSEMQSLPKEGAFRRFAECECVPASYCSVIRPGVWPIVNVSTPADRERLRFLCVSSG